MKKAGVDHFLVYIESVVFLQQIAYTSRNGLHQPFLYSSTPKPGGGVYFWNPHLTIMMKYWLIDVESKQEHRTMCV